MSRRVLLFALLVSCLFGLAGCAGAAPAEAPTVNARTPLPLPAQPTAPPVATRAPASFASATFAPILSVPGSGQVAATAAPAATAIRTATAAAGAPAQPAAGPTAPGVATGVRTELKAEFASALSTPEEVDEIEVVLKRNRGILDVSGNERAIAIGYDAGLILPDQIRALMASIGHPVKP